MRLERDIITCRGELIMNERDYDIPTIIYDRTEKPQGVYPLIRSIDKSVRELRDEFYEFKRERFSKLEGEVDVLKEDVKELKKDVADLKITTELTQRELREFKAETKAELKELSGEVSELKTDVKSLMNGMNRSNWILALIGAAIALIEFLKH